jgi:hypothetical protein
MVDPGGWTAFPGAAFADDLHPLMAGATWTAPWAA